MELLAIVYVLQLNSLKKCGRCKRDISTISDGIEQLYSKKATKCMKRSNVRNLPIESSQWSLDVMILESIGCLDRNISIMSMKSILEEPPSQTGGC